MEVAGAAFGEREPDGKGDGEGATSALSGGKKLETRAEVAGEREPADPATGGELRRRGDGICVSFKAGRGDQRGAGASVEAGGVEALEAAGTTGAGPREADTEVGGTGAGTNIAAVFVAALVGAVLGAHFGAFDAAIFVAIAAVYVALETCLIRTISASVRSGRLLVSLAA